MSDSNNNQNTDKKLSNPTKKRSLSNPDETGIVDKKSKFDYTQDMPVMLPTLNFRTSSIGATQATLSQPINFSDGGKYEILRARAIGATDENPEPEITIAPVTEAKSLGDFSNVITGDGKLFITATTQQSVTYNDLNVLLYQLEDGSITKRKFFNFAPCNNRYYDMEWIEHSGDVLSKGEGDDGKEYAILQHGFYMDIPEGNHVEVHFINNLIVGESISSVKDCDEMHKAFDDMKDNLVSKLGEKKPKYLVMFGQVTYNSDKTLRSLSPNIAPSCGLIMNNTIYSSEWDDDTNMTGWGCILIYG